VDVAVGDEVADEDADHADGDAEVGGELGHRHDLGAEHGDGAALVAEPGGGDGGRVGEDQRLAPQQVVGDGGRPLGVRLAVLDQDLDRVGAPAQAQPVPQPGPDVAEDEGIGLAEGHQRAALGET
jgi:hypothetical protein